MKILILSDIHGNQAAFRAALDRAKKYRDIEGCILLGDLIDYGMHSNEVIQMVRALPYPVLCNLRGNHEDAVLREEYGRFSSERGRESARYTRSILNQDSWEYLRCEMEMGGKKAFVVGGKSCLAVHGSLEEEYWISIRAGQPLSEYGEYDYVFSGHSHLPHLMEAYYPFEDVKRRNKKKAIFINPGSVGQPRNLNPRAQFVVLDVEREEAVFEKVEYEIEVEQAAYYGQVDDFYRERLKWGI